MKKQLQGFAGPLQRIRRRVASAPSTAAEKTISLDGEALDNGQEVVQLGFEAFKRHMTVSSDVWRGARANGNGLRGDEAEILRFPSLLSPFNLLLLH